jgi:hypothetical protein
MPHVARESFARRKRSGCFQSAGLPRGRGNVQRNSHRLFWNYYASGSRAVASGEQYCFVRHSFDDRIRCRRSAHAPGDRIILRPKRSVVTKLVFARAAAEHQLLHRMAARHRRQRVHRLLPMRSSDPRRRCNGDGNKLFRHIAILSGRPATSLQRHDRTVPDQRERVRHLVRVRLVMSAQRGEALLFSSGRPQNRYIAK